MPEVENIATRSPEISEAPTPDTLTEVREYYMLLREDYTRRMAEIEAFLGFAADQEGLGTRLHKVEAFLGINR